MTLEELNKVLKATGYPVAYSHFTSNPKNPLPKIGRASCRERV